MNKKLLTALEMKSLYDKEEQMSILDDLNLYYVAFTRAVDHLFIHFSGQSKKRGVSDLLINTIKQQECFNENKSRFFFGRGSGQKKSRFFRDFFRLSFLDSVSNVFLAKGRTCPLSC